jgi:uncharacterized protein YcbK (DUF882 family)
MTRLTTNFSLEEMIHSDTAVRKGIDNTPPADVLTTLTHTAQEMEKVRAMLIAPISVSSGYRCPELNKLVGGQPSSQHCKGEAVDFTAPIFGPPAQVMRKLAESSIKYDQIILEFDRWVHISFTATPRRQALIINSKGTRPWQ